MHVLWQFKLAVLSPLSTKFTSKRFLVGVCHHVSAQVFLVLGGKATVGTLVGAQIGMLLHVSLEKKHESHSDRVKVRGAFEIKKKLRQCWTVWETHLHLWPGGGSEVTIRTLEGVRIQVRPLVVLHVGASVERLHAYSTGKPLGAQTGRAPSGGRGWSFTAQLTQNKWHGQKEQYSV